MLHKASIKHKYIYRFLDRFTKFTPVLKISKHHCQQVQYSSLMCGDTACKNGALGGWVGWSVWFKKEITGHTVLARRRGQPISWAPLYNQFCGMPCDWHPPRERRLQWSPWRRVCAIVKLQLLRCTLVCRNVKEGSNAVCALTATNCWVVPDLPVVDLDQ